MLKRIYAPTLQWYVLREFLILGAVTLLATTLLMLLITVFLLKNEFEQFGISTGELLFLSKYLLPRAMVDVLPPATLIATVMVFGRMSAENEIIAAQAGGSPLSILILPLLICGVLISGFTLWLQDVGTRWANQKIRDEVVGLKKPEDLVKRFDRPGSSFAIQSDPVTSVRINLLAERDGPNGAKQRPIQIVTFKNGKQGDTIFADDHEWLPFEREHQALAVRLTNVQSPGVSTRYFSTIELEFQLPDISGIFTFGGKSSSRSWLDNWAMAERIRQDEKLRWEFLLRRVGDFGALAASSSPLDASSTPLTANSWNVARVHTNAIVEPNGGALDRMKGELSECHRKVALGLMPIVMVILGVGLGLLVKKSNRMIGFLTGLSMYCTLYIPLTIVAKSLTTLPQFGQRGYLAQYVPLALFLVVGLFLCAGSGEGAVSTVFGHIARAVRWVFEGLFFTKSGPAENDAQWSGQSVDASTQPNPGSTNPKRSFGIIGRFFVAIYQFLKWLVFRIAALPSAIFWNTVSRYVASTFIAPLFVIVVCIAGLIVVIDGIEHHAEIVDGIAKCQEPLGSLPVRSEGQAVLDVVIYYGILALDLSLDFMPFELLFAALLCAMVLVRNQEHLILKSSGMRLQVAMLPVILLSIAACIGVSVIREVAMPSLLMQRDYLKPLVYHRTAQSSSFALYTLDENKKPLLFVIGQYEPATETGKDLTIYLLGEEQNKRIPTISVHECKWDRQTRSWELYTNPELVEKEKQAQKLFGNSASSGGPAPEKKPPDPKKKPGVVQTSAELKRGAPKKVTDALVAPDEIAGRRDIDAETLRDVTRHKSQVNSWSGPIDPKYINNERLGAKVMRLDELEALSAQKPALKVDWFRRMSEALFGVLLICCALPLMFNDATGSPWKAIVLSVVFACVYFGGLEFSAVLARNGKFEPWIVLAPHALFLLMGPYMFFWHFET